MPVVLCTMCISIMHNVHDDYAVYCVYACCNVHACCAQCACMLRCANSNLPTPIEMNESGMYISGNIQRLTGEDERKNDNVIKCYTHGGSV